jgi:hypothetical protein
MDALVSLLLARKATLLSITSAIVFAITVSCGSPPQTPAASLITFPGTKLVHHQRETITAQVRPPLAPKEFLQIWVRADDNQWYPCESAKLNPASGAWNAICQFGSDKHPAHEGGQFGLGAFYTTNRVEADSLPDSVWSLLKTQQTAPVIFSRRN